MESRAVYVLYGSQTGNSEHIAKNIYDKLCEIGIDSKLFPLNAAKKIELKKEAAAILLICSTTGNGDAPENAELWWRSIKLRSAPKDAFSGIHYSVLGLGDTNYDKFCYMGKSIDKRLSELGGCRFLDLFCADEATNLEETVECWNTTVISALLKLMKGLTDASEGELEPQRNCSASDSGHCDVLESLQISEVSLQSTTENVQSLPFARELPKGIMNRISLTKWLNLSDTLATRPAEGLIPKVKSSSGQQSYELFNENLHSCDSNGPQSQTVEWSSTNPYCAEVKEASWLTSTTNIDNLLENDWGSSRRVAYLEISLKDSGIIYHPGDSIGICCPNPSYLVNIVIDRLRESHSLSGPGDIGINTKVYDASSSTAISLEELLSYRIDLVSAPRKLSLISLAKHCRDPSDESFIEWLCSKSSTGKSLWGQFIEAQGLGIAEFLALVPSCCPPLQALLEVVSPMPPRYYSVCTAQSLHFNSVGIAFSIVRFENGVTAPSAEDANLTAPRLKRFGVCTSYLENVLGPWLQLTKPSKCQSVVQLRIFHKPSLTFHLPSCISSPLILIGPGTGVAPFLGFLEHRSVLEKERSKSGDEISTGLWRGGFELIGDDLPPESNFVESYINSHSPGPIYLFFGCRNSDDYLFRNQLEGFLRDGTITKLEVAMSRIGPEKVYVTHKLAANAEVIANLILRQGAYVYVCGDGTQMAKDVLNAVKQLLVDHGNLSSEEASNWLDDMRLRRRYLVDVWS